MEDEDKKDFLRIPNKTGLVISPCGVCGAPGELWECHDDLHTGPRKAVMCTRPTAEEDGAVRYLGALLECPLWLAPLALYRATQREAIIAWNDTTAALNAARYQSLFSRGAACTNQHNGEPQ